MKIWRLRLSSFSCDDLDGDVAAAWVGGVGWRWRGLATAWVGGGIGWRRCGLWIYCDAGTLIEAAYLTHRVKQSVCTRTRNLHKPFPPHHHMHTHTQAASLSPIPPLSAFVVLRLVVTDAGIDADVDVIPPNPYDDPWNNQPWCGHRKKTRTEVLWELPVRSSTATELPEEPIAGGPLLVAAVQNNSRVTTRA